MIGFTQGVGILSLVGSYLGGQCVRDGLNLSTELPPPPHGIVIASPAVSPDPVAIGMGRPDSVASLLLQFFHPMLLIIGNGCGERHGPRHVELSEGDNERFSLLRRYDMAHDATFIAGI
jgi:hypothetical protein